MISALAQTTLMGLPLVAYGGIITLLLLLATASIGWAKFHGKLRRVSFFVHPGLAVLTILSATIHAIVGLSIYIGY